MQPMILAGDIGGTKTVLALFDDQGSGEPVAVENYPSRAHATFLELVDHFIARHPATISRACVGVAGPVKDGRCEATNLPWVVDAVEIAARLSLPSAALLNDLEAVGWGIPVLRAEDLVELNPKGREVNGNRAVIAAGTGLGQAGLFWDGVRHRPFATEGGHADFAPHDPITTDLLSFLSREYSRVSWERVVSGMGIANLYRFLKETGRETESPELAAAVKDHDLGAVVSEFAQSGKSGLCSRTMELFVALYGAQAGNLALTVMATGGIYLGGGIAPKNLAAMKGPGFLAAFTTKGRLSGLVDAIPVRLILDQRTGLRGAAHFASL